MGGERLAVREEYAQIPYCIHPDCGSERRDYEL